MVDSSYIPVVIACHNFPNSSLLRGGSRIVCEWDGMLTKLLLNQLTISIVCLLQLWTASGRYAEYHVHASMGRKREAERENSQDVGKNDKQELVWKVH